MSNSHQGWPDWHNGAGIAPSANAGQQQFHLYSGLPPLPPLAGGGGAAAPYGGNQTDTNGWHNHQISHPASGGYASQQMSPMPVLSHMLQQQQPMHHQHQLPPPSHAMMGPNHPPPALPYYHPPQQQHQSPPMIPPPPPPQYLHPFSGQQQQQQIGMYQNPPPSSCQPRARGYQQGQGLLQPPALAVSSQKDQRADLKREDSFMDMSVDDDEHAGENRAAAAATVSFSSILKRKILQFREKNGQKKTMASLVFKTLATLAQCKDEMNFPLDENLLQDMIKRANTAIIGDYYPQSWKLIDGLLRSNVLLETDANGFLWHLATIDKLLASIESATDLEALLVTKQPAAKPAAAAGRPVDDHHTLLEMMLEFERSKKWAKDTSHMGNFLKSNPKFKLIKTRKADMKAQRNKVESMLKNKKFLEINASGIFIWNYQNINAALTKAGLALVQHPGMQQNKSVANIIGLSDHDLHQQVVEMFDKFRSNGFWPWTSVRLNDILTNSPIFNFAKGGEVVETVRKEIIRRVFMPRQYVLDETAFLTWQMDAIDKGLVAFGYDPFRIFTTNREMDGVHRNVLASFRSCYQQFRWPEDIDKLKTTLESQKVLDTLTSVQVLTNVLLPNGYVSIGVGSTLSWHYNRIHLASGMPDRGQHYEVLKKTAGRINRNHSEKSVEAASTCHNIFMTMKFWPKNRAELTQFVNLKTDKRILDFLNIPPFYEVPEKVRSILEPLFTAAELLIVDSKKDYAYAWSADITGEASTGQLTSNRADSPTSAGQALERNNTFNSARSGPNQSEERTPSLQPQRAGTSDATVGVSDAGGDIEGMLGAVKRPAPLLMANTKKKQRVDPGEAVESVIVNDGGSGGPTKIELIAKLAAVTKSVAEAGEKLKRAQKRRTIILRPPEESSVMASAHRFPPLAKGLKNVTAMSRTLIIRIDPDDDPNLVYFAPEYNVDHIILQDDLLHAAQVKLEAGRVKEEPKEDSRKVADKEKPTSIVSLAMKLEASKQDLLKRRKIHAIAIMEQLLKKQELLLANENREVAKYTEQLESCTKNIDAASTKIKAYNIRIPEMEKAVAEMEEMIAEKVALITLKRQEMQLFE